MYKSYQELPDVCCHLEPRLDPGPTAHMIKVKIIYCIRKGHYVTYIYDLHWSNIVRNAKLVIGLFLSSAFILSSIVFILIRMSLSTRNYFWLLILIAVERSWDASVTSDTASLITKQSDFLWASEFNSDLRKITFPPVLVFTLDLERISSELGLQLLIVQ